ncbi:hypothetical protein, partial [Bacillus anthracis]|uniref:hypothetical protein n=1 Tax=Bacillus anthracis TaxID=1392 RepID=UPI0039A5FDC6
MKYIQKRFFHMSVACFVLALSGCATDALDLAPSSPDKPWVPKQNQKIAGGQQASSQSSGDKQPDFSVPANPALSLMATPVTID